MNKGILLILAGGAALLAMDSKKKKVKRVEHAKKKEKYIGYLPVKEETIDQYNLDDHQEHDIEYVDEIDPDDISGGEIEGTDIKDNYYYDDYEEADPEDYIPLEIPPEPTDSIFKPASGPDPGDSCAISMYSQDPVYIQPLFISQKAWNAFSESNYYFNIKAEYQRKIYESIYNFLMNMKNDNARKTVLSVIVRRVLSLIDSSCDWFSIPMAADANNPPESMVAEGALRLGVIAAITSGYKDPEHADLFQTGDKLTVPREAIGDLDPGFMGAENGLDIGRRIEIIATDEGANGILFNAEHLIGKVSQLSGPNGEPHLFAIEIIDNFNNEDVSPKIASHGFNVGDVSFFSKKRPTGIYRIYKEGVA